MSEAVRGEGASCVDDAGVRFMQGQHELADLAPRDVVAKAILRRMRETGAEHVWLDARRFGAEKWRVALPDHPRDAAGARHRPGRHDLIPVVPALPLRQRAACAPTSTGESSLPGLFACGECACTGVHGANRLASNSLLEGLVFGRAHRATSLAAGLPARRDPAAPTPTPGAGARSTPARAATCSS